MIEYTPWSQRELTLAKNAHKEGRLVALDLEVGGECSFSCAYCDSPNRSLRAVTTAADVRRLVRPNHIRWLYICGLGEPTHPRNRTLLYKCINIARDCGLRVSLFTNCSGVDERLLSSVAEGVVFLLFKLDSLHPEVIEKVYGIDSGAHMLRKIEKISEYVDFANGYTNIAASIVPTQLNREEIGQIATWCVDRNIFPLIGQLEAAGLGAEAYTDLSLSEPELWELRHRIEDALESKYSVPMCPAVMGGVHVNHGGKVVVDRMTGLSCSWFWLKTPDVEVLRDFGAACSWEDIEKDIMSYRQARVSAVRDVINDLRELPVGGCGGDIVCLLRDYLKLLEG